MIPLAFALGSLDDLVERAFEVTDGKKKAGKGEVRELKTQEGTLSPMAIYRLALTEEALEIDPESDSPEPLIGLVRARLIAASKRSV